MKSKYGRLFGLFIITAMLCSVLCVNASASSKSGSCGVNATWSYNTDTKVLTINGSGLMSNYTSADESFSSEYIVFHGKICNKATNIVINGVSSIGAYAFAGMTSLKTVTIGSSVTSIAKNAFEGCSSLTSVNVNKTEKIRDRAFYNCSSLTKIDGVCINKVGTEAFKGTKLKNISLLNKHCSLSDTSFSGCSNLTVKCYYGTTPYNFCVSKGINTDCPVYQSIEVIPDGENEVVTVKITVNGVKGLETGLFELSYDYNVMLPPQENIYVGENTGTETSYDFDALGRARIAVMSQSGLSNSSITFSIDFELKYATNGKSDTSDFALRAEDVVINSEEYKLAECSLTDVFLHDYTVTDTSTCILAGTKTSYCPVCGKNIVENVGARGHDLEETVIKKATCTEAGKSSFKCKNCDYSENEKTIKALGHNYSADYTVDKAADCTTAGSKSRHCTRCTAKTDVTEIKALGHNYSSAWITEATCTTAGVREYRCTRCDDNYTEDVKALGHNFSANYVTDSVKTCTVDGVKSRHCTRCSERTDITIDYHEGHKYDNSCDTTCNVCGATRSITHQYSAWTTVPATCTVAGSKTRTCSVCKKVDKQTIDALGHNWNSYMTVDVEASCGGVGSKSYHCSRCTATKGSVTFRVEHSYTVKVWNTGANSCIGGYYHMKCANCGDVQTTAYNSSGSGHTFVSYAIKAATCTQGGVTKAYKYCSVCDKYYKSSAPVKRTTSMTVKTYLSTYEITDISSYLSSPLNHNYTATVTKQPTCVATGVKTYKCSRCTSSYTEDIPINSDNHLWDSGVVKTPATCKATGKMKYTCTLCKTATKETDIPKLTTHKYTEKVSAENLKSSATCKQKAVYYKSCSVCGEKSTDTFEYGNYASHSYVEKVSTDYIKSTASCCCKAVYYKSCGVCGAKSTDTFEYGSLGNHNYGSWVYDGATKQHTRTCITNQLHKETANCTFTGSITKQPTCKNYGEKTYTCSVCKGVYKENITKLTTHTWNGGVVTKQPTCKDSGVKTYTCTVCSLTKTEEVAKLTTHSWDNGVITKQPTCKDYGVKTYTCTVCSATKTESVPKTDIHIWDSGKIAEEPTCKDKGLMVYSCTVCKITKSEEIEKTENHKYDDGVVTKEPTVTENGEKTFTCTVCGDTKTEEIEKLSEEGKQLLSGDVDFNGKVNTKDARVILKAVARLITLSDEETAIADVDGNGKINTKDARLILRVVAKLDALPNQYVTYYGKKEEE